MKRGAPLPKISTTSLKKPKTDINYKSPSYQDYFIAYTKDPNNWLSMNYLSLITLTKNITSTQIKDDNIIEKINKKWLVFSKLALKYNIYELNTNAKHNFMHIIEIVLTFIPTELTEDDLSEIYYYILKFAHCNDIENTTYTLNICKLLALFNKDRPIKKQYRDNLYQILKTFITKETIGIKDQNLHFNLLSNILNIVKDYCNNYTQYSSNSSNLAIIQIMDIIMTQLMENLKNESYHLTIKDSFKVLGKFLFRILNFRNEIVTEDLGENNKLTFIFDIEKNFISQNEFEKISNTVRSLFMLMYNNNKLLSKANKEIFEQF